MIKADGSNMLEGNAIPWGWLTISRQMVLETPAVGL